MGDHLPLFTQARPARLIDLSTNSRVPQACGGLRCRLLSRPVSQYQVTFSAGPGRRRGPSPHIEAEDSEEQR
jgi:hypothetical protein